MTKWLTNFIFIFDLEHSIDGFVFHNFQKKGVTLLSQKNAVLSNPSFLARKNKFTVM